MGQDPAGRAEVHGRGLGARLRTSAVPEGDRPIGLLYWVTPLFTKSRVQQVTTCRELE